MAQEWGEHNELDESTEATQMAEASQVDRAAEGTPKSCTDDFKFSRQDPGKLDENVKRFPPIAFEMFAGSCKLSKCVKSHGFAALGIDHNRH